MQIANVFNDHFSSLGKKVQRKIPIERGSYRSYLLKRNNNGKYVINPDGQTFFLTLGWVPFDIFVRSTEWPTSEC